MVKKSTGSHCKIPQWFNRKCKISRKKFHRAKYRYKLRSTNINKLNVKIKSQEYKKTLSAEQKAYKLSNIKQMRKIKKSEPRKFWKFLNGNKKLPTEVTVEDCFEHFSAMNSSDYDRGPERNFDTNFENLQADNEELNAPILWSEIEKAVSSLKNNKSGGLDMILNEHIKSCYKIPSIKDILLKYFNIILDSGIVPQDWSVGKIIPIYKQKGDPGKCKRGGISTD